LGKVVILFENVILSSTSSSCPANHSTWVWRESNKSPIARDTVKSLEEVTEQILWWASQNDGQ
jgi:hypothetical protein